MRRVSSAAMLASILLLTGCSGSESDDSAVDETGATANAAEATGEGQSPEGEPSGQSGGELVVSMFEDADLLDPTFGGTAGGREVFVNLCEKLYDIDADSAIVPQLATELPEVSDDGLTVDISLRNDIAFTDGTPFDAEAVKTSLDRHREHPESNRASALAGVEEVEVVDTHAVRLLLAEPNAALLAELTDRSGMIMSPTQLEELGDEFGTAPVCVGPFEFVDRVVGDSITLKKSETYYDSDAVQLDGIVYRPMPDATVRFSNLNAGDLHVVDRLSPTDMDAAESDEGIDVMSVVSHGYEAIAINIANVDGIGQEPGQPDHALAQDPLIREAFELTLDREQINEVVYGGLHTPGCTPLSPASPFHPDDMECPTRDVERAQELIEEAGAETPIAVEMMVSNSPEKTRLGEVIQSMAADAGFEVTILPTEPTTWLDAASAGNFEASQIPWSGRVDPDGNLYQFHHSTGGDNYGNAQDDEIDALLDEARAETVEEDRRALYQEAVDLISERRNLIYLLHQNILAASASNVQGFEMYVDGTPRLKHAYFAD